MAMIVTSLNHSCPSLLQNVIPQQLLDQYLSMTDPAQAQTVDTEIAKHCAFSLPGVALTLGRQNWHCLKDTYETLATDVQVGAFGFKSFPLCAQEHDREKSGSSMIRAWFGTKSEQHTMY